MAKSRSANVTDEHRAEAAELKKLWKLRKESDPKLSQAAFGAEYGIGTQAAVGFFLNGKSPLSLKAARGFATGLGCDIAEFSKRLAAEAAKNAAFVASPPQSPNGWPFKGIDPETFRKLKRDQKIEIQGAVRKMITDFTEANAAKKTKPSGESSASSHERQLESAA